MLPGTGYQLPGGINFIDETLCPAPGNWHLATEPAPFENVTHVTGYQTPVTRKVNFIDETLSPGNWHLAIVTEDNSASTTLVVDNVTFVSVLQSCH
jgi:hypothetical protein